MEMGTALREADSALQTPRSSSNCAKQLQERNTSRNGKMFPLIFLGLVPSKKALEGGGGPGLPATPVRGVGPMSRVSRGTSAALCPTPAAPAPPLPGAPGVGSSIGSPGGNRPRSQRQNQ